MTVKELRMAIKAINDTIKINGLLKAELIEIYNDIVEVDTPKTFAERLRAVADPVDTVDLIENSAYEVTTDRGVFIVDTEKGTMMNTSTAVVENYDHKLFEHKSSSRTIASHWVECDGDYSPISDTILIPYCVDGVEGVSQFELGYDESSELPIVYKVKSMFGGSESFTMALGYNNTLAYVLKHMVEDLDYHKILELYGLDSVGVSLIQKKLGFILSLGDFATCKAITDGARVTTKRRTKRQL